MADRARESGVEHAAPVFSGARRNRRRRAAAAQEIGVQVYSDLDSLPDSVAAFLAAEGERSFFCSLAWFRIVLRTAGSRADQPRLYAAELGGRVVAVLVLRERRGAGWLKTHVVTSPSRALDAVVFWPLLDAEQGDAGVRAIVAAMLRAAPPVHVLRFDCLDPLSRECRVLMAALRERHMLVQTFADPFALYGEDVQGLSLEHYLGRRSPNMREFIARQVGALAESGRGRFELITGGPRLASALVDYALVDLQSLKDQERYPDCLAQLLETASRAGILRLGLLYVDDVPAAAQIWIVSSGRATIWRSRFARKFALLSVGTVLTFEMIRYVLTADKPSEIEFGPSDEIGRQEWLSRRRDRVGLSVFNPFTVKGWGSAARHFGGFAAKFPLVALRAIRRRLFARA